MATKISIPSSSYESDSPSKRNRRSILSSMSPSKSDPRIQTNGLVANGDSQSQLPSPASPRSTDSIPRAKKSGSMRNGNATGNANAVASPTSGAAPALKMGWSNGILPQNGQAKTNGTAERASLGALEVPSGGLGGLRRRMSNLSIASQRSQDDRASVHSKQSASHKDAISSFIRRRSTRGGSEPPEAHMVDDDESIASKGGEPTRRSSFMRKRTLSSATSRMKLGKLGGRGKKNGEAADGEELSPSPTSGSLHTGSANVANSGPASGQAGSGASQIHSGPSVGSDEVEEDSPKATRSSILRDSHRPVGYPGSKTKGPTGLSTESPATNTPAADVRRAQQGKGAPLILRSEGNTRNASAEPAPRSPEPADTGKVQRVGSARAKSRDVKESPGKEQSAEQQRGYIGAATAAVGGLLGFAGAREADKADDGYQSESDGSEDEFHDAELGDIHEDDEEQETSGEKDRSDEESEHEEEASPAPAPRSPTSKQSAYARAGRSRGVSESSGRDEAKSSKKSRKGGAISARRTGSPEQMDESAANPSAGPARLKGTSAAKRRAGSEPVGQAEEDGPTSTPSDAKAKKETPADVKEKSARVAKMGYDDVKEDTEEMRDDIETARGALHLFLNSRMIEAEDIIKTKADYRMYYALGNCLIATMKGFMTFEPEDLATAISYCKDAMHIAQLLRKPSNTVANFGRFVRGSGHSPSAFASMTPVQRHAELVYVEAQLLKSCLGIVYSGDFFGFVAEALHMRNAYGVYRSLAKYVDTADSKASGNRDDDIDEDFRSGVYLGSGLITMILGLLPGKILGLMSAFGYEGDTKAGLQTLMRAGGWKASGQDRPAIGIKDEGIRRSVCDMGILLFHLVVSVFIPVTGVDIPFADRILHYHLKRYPNGVFFLYFSGRLYSTQARCEKAIKQYAAARDAQEEYIQLKHISWWDASLCHMSLAQWRKAQTCFDVLLKESNWSKCVYTYGVGANMAQADEEAATDGTGGAAKRKTKSEAADLFAKVPGLMQRIAGKSIPMEKFVAKKATKFNKQGRLLLPAVEFSYIYHCLSNAPRYALTDDHLVMISDALSDLNEHESSPSSYHSGEDEFWDDFCLAHFLRGVVLRHIATPEAHAKSDPRDEENEIPNEEAQQQALLSFQTVLENGHRITMDHYIIYFSHYELGRLHADMGEYGEAKKELDLVLSGKMLEDKGTRKGNHKYGMQNMALLRSNGALNNLKQQGRV